MKLKSYTIAAFCATCAWSALAQNPNIVSNSNFTLVPPLAAGATQAELPGSTNIPGWTVDTTPPDGVLVDGGGGFDTAANGGVTPLLVLTDGNGETTGGGVSQTIATVVGHTYIVSLAVGRYPVGAAAAPGNFAFGSVNTPISYQHSQLAQQTFTVVATATNTLINITGSATSGTSQTLISNVTIVDANIVSNGNFVLNPALASTATQALPAGSTAIPGWTVDTTTPDGVVAGGATAFVPQNGSSLVELTLGDGNQTTGGGIHQTLTTVPGTVYIVSFDLARTPSGSGNTPPGNINFGGVNTPIAQSAGSTTFMNGISFTVVATSTSTLFDITGIPVTASGTGGVNQQLYINNVSVIASSGVLPSITTQPSPANSTNFTGASNSYSVTATGTAPLSYQWYQNTNTLLPGATNATLALNNLVSTNAGAYTVVVSNVAGSVTSSVVHLTVLATASNLVQNPGFELPNVTSSGPGFATYSPGDSTDIPHWTVDSASNPDPDGVVLGEPGAFGPNNGTQNLLLSGAVSLSTGGGVSQTISTTPGAVYTVSIQVAAQSGFNGYPSGSPVTGTFYFGNEAYTLTGTGTSFTTYFWQVTAEASSTVIDVVGSATSSVGQLVVDNVYVGATPGAGSAPGIQTQPSNVLSGLDGSATFTVAALGLQPFSYQWYYNGHTAISGATTNPLILNSVQLTNAGSYTVVVSNALGSVTSSVATLTVFSDVNPSFTLNPALASGVTQQIAPGNSTTIPGWIVDTTPPDGVNAGGLGAFVANNGSPQLELTDGVGETTGGGIHQTIATVPGTIYTISLDLARTPSGSGNTPPGNVAFGSVNLPLVQATGSTTFSALSWTVIATSNSTLIDITGCTNSATQQLIINNVEIYPTPGQVGVPASITSQPSPSISTNALAGSLTLSTTGGGTYPLSYQWQFDGTNIAGATGNTLALNNLQTTNAGGYNVIVSNQFGMVTSAVAYVLVAAGPPVILNYQAYSPLAQGVGLFTITPIVSGAQPLDFEQWYFQSNSLSAETALPGDTNATITLSGPAGTNSGLYSLAVSNSSGAITGLVANLTVTVRQGLSSVNVDVNGGENDINGTFESYFGINYVGLAAYADATTNTYWNPMVENGTTPALLNSDGVTHSGITFTESQNEAYTTYGSAGPGLQGTATQFFYWFVYLFGGPLTCSLNNVPAGNYDLYVYAANIAGGTGLANARLSIYTVGVGTNTPSIQTNVADLTSTFVLGNNFLLFSNVVVPAGGGTISFSYQAGPGSVNNESDFDGLQLVTRPAVITPTIAISQATTNIIVTYLGGALQAASVLNGTWTNVTGATSPYTIPHPLQTEQFYRVQ
jgi:hypothetical protein